MQTDARCLLGLQASAIILHFLFLLLPVPPTPPYLWSLYNHPPSLPLPHHPPHPPTRSLYPPPSSNFSLLLLFLLLFLFIHLLPVLHLSFIIHHFFLHLLFHLLFGLQLILPLIIYLHLRRFQ